MRVIVKLATFFAFLHIAVASEIDRKSVDDENYNSVRVVADGINQFSKNFHETLFQELPRENIIYSPLSVAMVLMMAAYGARGKTLQEMNEVLRISTNETVQRNGVQSLISQLNDAKKNQFRLANKIFIRNDLEINSNFKALTASTFQSEIKNLNFSDLTGACQEINNWCEQQTNSRVKNIVQPSDFDEETILVLANAAYFKGNWAKKFNENSTELGNFYRSDNTTKEVLMMHDIDKYQCGDLPELSARFIQLPYESDDVNNAMSMIIILPNKFDGLQKVEENFYTVNFTELLNGDMQDVDLFMPKFKIQSKLDLKSILFELGMKEIFGNNANFTRIINQPPLKVSKIIQKAFIEVNEEGSEAAAVTEFELENRIGNDDVTKQIAFHVNRPFLALIVSEDVILFSARVLDPSI